MVPHMCKFELLCSLLQTTAVDDVVGDANDSGGRCRALVPKTISFALFILIGTHTHITNVNKIRPKVKTLSDHNTKVNTSSDHHTKMKVFE